MKPTLPQFFFIYIYNFFSSRRLKTRTAPNTQLQRELPVLYRCQLIASVEEGCGMKMKCCARGNMTAKHLQRGASLFGRSLSSLLRSALLLTESHRAASPALAAACCRQCPSESLRRLFKAATGVVKSKVLQFPRSASSAFSPPMESLIELQRSHATAPLRLPEIKIRQPLRKSC